MSPFAKLMLRFGWIRLSSYGLEVTLDGRLVSARLLPEAQLDLDWSNVPSPAVDLASTFDPALATTPTRTPPPLPAARPRKAVATTPQASFLQATVWPAPAPTSVARPSLAQASVAWPSVAQASVAPASVARPSVAQASVAPASVAANASADDSLSEEEEWAWQAAVARAKAESDSAIIATPKRSNTEDEAAGFADTAKLPGSAIKQPPQTARPDPAHETSVAAEQPVTDEDWELLVAAARSREHTAADNTAHQNYEDTKIDPDPQLSKLAAAQVTRADVPANLATPTSADASQDDEWIAMRRQIEAKDSEENARKMRAMREIQRLQGRAPLADFMPRRVVAQPQRKRVAAGTSPAPTARPTIPATTVLPARRPSPIAATGNHDTKIDLPRVTERLSR